MLDELKKKMSLTILMVSHDIDRALKFADNVIEMQNGKITFNGNTADYIKVGGIK